MARRVWTYTICLGLMFASPCPALGQSGRGSYEPPPSARRLAEDGFKLFKEGRYQEAASLLEQAQKGYQAPQYLLYIGRAYAKIGKLVEARSAFVAAGEMSVPVAAPQEFAGKFEKARTLAAEDLAQLSKRLPTVKLAVKGPPSAAVRVSETSSTIHVVVEQEVVIVQMNVGEHVLHVEASGFAPTDVRFSASEQVLGVSIETVSVILDPLVSTPTQPVVTGSQGSATPVTPVSSPPHPGPPLVGSADLPVVPVTLSHLKQFGAFVRGDFQLIDGGAVAVVGVSIGLHDFVEPYVGAILGRDFGFEPGVAVYFLRGALKPRIDLAVPIFFEDRAYAGIRGAAGAQWDPSRHFGVFLQVGGAVFPNTPAGYTPFSFLPSAGVQGRI